MVSKFVTFFVLASTVVSAAPIELFRRAPSFAEIDISRLGGNGVEAEANAAKVCPSTLSPADLEAIRKVAEDAEKTVFNAGLSAATDTDAKKAIQCQKDRNKVLKNHCQLVKAQLQNDAAQIAENTKQLTKNRNDVTTRCANVDTKKFIGAGNATPPKTGGNAGNAGNTGNGAVAGGAVSFASIDISRKAGDGTAASNNAKAVCPSTLSPAALEAIRRVAEDAEKTVFNAALAKTTDKTAKAAIQCQKDRNKVLKNTCQLVKAQLQNDQAQIDENTKQLKKNTGDVTSRCGNVDTTKFVVGAAGFTAQAADEADETDETEVDSFAAESTDDESAETEEADDVAAESTDEADDETDGFAAESTDEADDETDGFAAESTEDAGDESDAFAAESTDEADETDVADDFTAEAADESEGAEETEDAAESA